MSDLLSVDELNWWRCPGSKDGRHPHTFRTFQTLLGGTRLQRCVHCPQEVVKWTPARPPEHIMPDGI